MKTTIVIGNATVGSNIHFRKTSFLTETNRTHIEDCVHAFIELPMHLAFKNLVRMTCCPKEDITNELWENIRLDPMLVPAEAWNSFVNELRYQYKIRHNKFMEEFTVPAECLAAYDALASHTSEVAAYRFYKKAYAFLCDHIATSIGQDHISDTFNRLNWHSRDPEVNRAQQFKGLRRLSLRGYEADYFCNYLEKCIALLQCMFDYMNMDEQSPITEQEENSVANADDLPFFFGDSKTTAVTETQEKLYLELSFENVLEYETDFLGFVLNNDIACQDRLHTAGFDMEQVRCKAIAIYRVLHSHSEMVKAVEELSK